MKLLGRSIFATSLLLAACGRDVDPASHEERLRAEAERSAALEAAEKEILKVGLPPPAEAEPEPVAAENETGSTNGATEVNATNSTF